MGGKIAGIILAGGRSTRMGGGDKSLRLLAGRPVLSHVIERLRPQADPIVLNANGPRDRFAAFGLEVISDPIADAGPLAGVLAGMTWSRQRDLRLILTVAADTPFYPRDLADRLEAAQDGPERIVQASSAGSSHPTFALWPVSLADDLNAFLRDCGSASMRAFAGERHRPAVVKFSSERGLDPFFNINTHEDLRKAEEMAVEMRR